MDGGPVQKIPEKSKFVWLGNQTAINFVNTQIIANGNLVDLLEHDRDVVEWMREAELLSKSTLPPGVLAESRSYRLQLRSAFDGISRGQRIRGRVIASTNTYLASRPTVQHLERTSSSYVLTTSFQRMRSADSMFPIAKSFAELLSAGDLSRVRKCANPDCILYFYDTSKGGRRSWCSLDLCGNKLRMAASRARRSTVL